MCVCGHPRSQHPEGKCDYSGYSCQCVKYRQLKSGQQVEDSLCIGCGKILAIKDVFEGVAPRCKDCFLKGSKRNPLGVSWFWWLIGGGILWYKYKKKG